MEDVTRASIEKHIQKVCINENVINPKVKFSTSGPKNGFVGGIVRIEIIGENNELHLIAKYAPMDDEFREKLQVHDLFLREIKLYVELLPLYKKLQDTYGAKDPFVSSPKCYGFDDTPKFELLILDDLIHAGYNLKNSLVPMDAEHLRFTLREYGKWHAVSLAYKHHDFEGYKQLLNTTENMQKKFLDTKTIDLFIVAMDSLKDIFGPNEDFFEAFTKVCENFLSTYDRVTNSDEHAVLYHGDSWCNNFMFKYNEDSTSPTSMKFIDYQMTACGSLVLDLSYFLMANSSPESIKNIEDFLKFYYSGLAKSLRDLGCDPEEIYPWSLFKDQWKKYSIHGLYMGIVVLKLALTESDERPDLSENFDNSMNCVGKHADEYKRRVEAIVRYYYDAGII